MRTLPWTAAALATAILGLASSAQAGDLKALPRTLTKQPTYVGKPSYCLLVVGPEMKTRVWLVQDGDVLYVDRNANGDLTEDGEKVALAEAPEVEEDESQRLTLTKFEIGALAAGVDASTSELLLTRRVRTPKPGAAADVTAFDVTEVSALVSAVGEQAARPCFAPKPADAPVVHFGGPLSIALEPTRSGEPHVLFLGEDEQELTVQIGSAGLGAGTWAPISHDKLADDVNPLVEITFPPARPGAAPLQVKFTLDQRC